MTHNFPHRMMLQAGSTIGTYLDDAVKELDEQFGKGYAKSHPEVVASFLKACAQDFHTAMIYHALEGFEDPLSRLTDGLEAVADAISEK